MFGYIKPFSPELKMREFDAYKAVYCSLCRQLGENFGPLAKMTLSYDYTFVAMLSIGLSDDAFSLTKTRCMANPLKKKPCVCRCKEISFVADCAMLMFYYKVKDNIQDHRGIQKLPFLFLLPFFASARKKALKRSKTADTLFSQMMEGQKRVEQKCSESLDEAAEPTALALAGLMEQFAHADGEKRILNRLGYLLGRFVYLSDALDDLSEDAKHRTYNPFLLKFAKDGLDPNKKKEILEYGKGVLNITVAELGLAYELLTLRHYEPILSNIIYLGLRAAIKNLGSGNPKRKKAEAFQ